MDNDYLYQHKHKDLTITPIGRKRVGKPLKERKPCVNGCGRYIGGQARYCVICKVEVEHARSLVRDRLKYQRKKLKNL